MNALTFFADENVQEFLIKWLIENGYNVSGIRSENLVGLDDESIIEKAFLEGKIIITHDSDFGKIVFTKNVKFYAIIFLRAGHHIADFHIATLKTILKHPDKIKEGSIIIGVRKNETIKIRFRFLNSNS